MAAHQIPAGTPPADPAARLPFAWGRRERTGSWEGQEASAPDANCMHGPLSFHTPMGTPRGLRSSLVSHAGFVNAPGGSGGIGV
jgi:hypothetical protein